MTSLSVVIPTWQRASWLDRCLSALRLQEPTPGEVIVVGRPEDRPAREVVERHLAARKLPMRWADVRRPGHVAPVLAGLEAAGGDLVAFLDDDAEPEPCWLSELLAPFADARVACVGGRVLMPTVEKIVRPDAGQIRWYGKHVGNVAALEGPEPVDVSGVMECNWAWRREALRSLVFDPRLDFDDASMYGLDLCLQARERGWRVVYQPAARVTHHLAPRDPSLDREERVQRRLSYARNYTLIGLKHFRGCRRAAFVAWWWLVGERSAYGVGGAIVDALRGRSHILPLTVAALRGRWQGVRAWRQGR